MMRHVFEQPDEARTRGALARSEILEHHAPGSAGKAMEDRRRVIHGRRMSAGE
jgi:hypothetical protein